MSKKRPNHQDASSSGKQDAPRPKSRRPASGLPWHPLWRCLVSLLVILHLAAVFSAPWDLSIADAVPPGQRKLPAPNSNLWQRPVVPRALCGFFRHYLNLAYLNHGYEFFAPDPAGTHVIRYRASQPDGSVVDGEFPNRQQQWPRLLYHRHMMLTEQTGLMGPESGQHYADHLATLHGGRSRMELLFHHLLPPDRVRKSMPLDEPSTYQVIATVNGQLRPDELRGSTEGAIAIPEAGR